MINVKKYFKIKNNNKEIKASVSYELGGMNYFSGKSNARGYYLYIQPVERADNCESFEMFDGFKVCLLQVNRQSKKQEQIAINKANEIMFENAKKMALSKGWELEEVQE